MDNNSNSAESSYNEICVEMKNLVTEIDENIEMTEERYNNIIKRYEKLSIMLENYGKIMSYKK